MGTTAITIELPDTLAARVETLARAEGTTVGAKASELLAGWAASIEGEHAGPVTEAFERVRTRYRETLRELAK